MQTANLIRALTRAWFIFVLVASLLVLWTIQQVQADTAELGSSERLVTIYDRGQEQIIITKATTIRAALDQADIELDEADKVEPARDEELIAKTYSVNIYRARPIIVEDGQVRVKVVTAAQSPRSIATEAGVKLYDEDVTDLRRIDNVVDGGGAGLELQVDRATEFSFNLYGEVFSARTQATTVGEMLKEKAVELGPKDGVTPNADTPLTSGLRVHVWRDGKQTITLKQPIKMPVEEVQDHDREIGYRAVRTPGAPGEQRVTYEIVMKNGQEVSRIKIAAVVTKQPTKRVVVVGAKVPVIGGSKADWMAAAGIAPSDYMYVDQLIQKESGWNPRALNSSSGACGLVQALPCSKLGPEWYDPVVALRWGDSYVKNRYGSWAGAVSHSHANGWY